MTKSQKLSKSQTAPVYCEARCPVGDVNDWSFDYLSCILEPGHFEDHVDYEMAPCRECAGIHAHTDWCSLDTLTDNERRITYKFTDDGTYWVIPK